MPETETESLVQIGARMLAGSHSQIRQVSSEEKDLFKGLKPQVEAMGGV